MLRESPDVPWVAQAFEGTMHMFQNCSNNIMTSLNIQNFLWVLIFSPRGKGGGGMTLSALKRYDLSVSCFFKWIPFCSLVEGSIHINIFCS